MVMVRDKVGRQVVGVAISEPVGGKCSGDGPLVFTDVRSKLNCIFYN